MVAEARAVNRLELRCADSLFEVHVNGALAASLIDARFGYGMFGWRVGAGEMHGAVELAVVELHHVA